MTSWRGRALCLRFTDLPWIADPRDRSRNAEVAMQGVCHACPVFEECDTFARTHRVTSGFYAGQDRTPKRSPAKDRTDGAA